MAKLFISGSKIGSNVVKFTSSMVDVANKKIKQVKQTTCTILDENRNIISQASVRKLSDDNDITDVGRKFATEKALNNVENKKTKKELYQWYVPIMQQVEKSI